MNGNPEHGIFSTAPGQAGLVKYACRSCGEAILTTPPLNMLVICTLCEEVLAETEIL